MINLRFIREKNDLTIRKFAESLNISKTYYGSFETGERIITIRLLNRLCNRYHVSSDYALGLINRNVVSKEKYILSKKLIASRVKEIRVKNKLTQKQFAKMLHTSQSTISSYENGKTIILTGFLIELCRKFKVSSDYILGRSNTIKVIIK